MSRTKPDKGVETNGTRVFGFAEFIALSGIVVVAIAFFLSLGMAASLFWLGGAAIFFAMLEPAIKIVVYIKSVAPAVKKAK